MATSNDRKRNFCYLISKFEHTETENKSNCLNSLGQASFIYACTVLYCVVRSVRNLFYSLIMFIVVYTIYMPSAFSTRIKSEIIAAENLPEMRSLLLI